MLFGDILKINLFGVFFEYLCQNTLAFKSAIVGKICGENKSTEADQNANFIFL